MRFELLEPQSIEEAVSHLSELRDESRVIAGGQSLLLMIRSGLVRPRVLVSLGALGDLSKLELSPEGTLTVGALATHRQIWKSQPVREKAHIVAQAVSQIGSTPVRNFGTIGGNVCHNEMGSDPPPALLVLDAKAECVSSRGRRKISLSDFLTGFFETCLEPDEILVGLEIPPAPPQSKGVYLKHTLRSGDLAIVGVAALLEVGDGFCREARLALGGVGPVPFRAREAENALRQSPVTDSAIEEAASAAAAMSDPISDAHASADYRKKMVRVFVKRAIRQAMEGRPSPIPSPWQGEG